jgi:hypothetical protein
MKGDVLEVSLLRVRPEGRRARTLCRQILFALRKECRRLSGVEVRITDRYISPVISFAADFEDFRPVNGELSCLLVDVSGTGEEVGAKFTDIVSRKWGFRDIPNLSSGMAARPAMRIERSFWPAKILDSELRTFTISITPHWSSELFGRPEALFARPSELGISQEHVYYRSAQPGPLVAPARILWYLTRHSGNEGSLIGTSLLDDVIEGTPEALYERYSHLGVYTLGDIRAAAGKRGIAQALRFSKTDLFDSPVGHKAYQELALSRGTRPFLQSPQRVSSDIFAAVWARGRRKDVGGQV